VAKVIYTRLCKEINKDKSTGAYSLKGSFVQFAWMEVMTWFVFVVYWQGRKGESFRQSFALINGGGVVFWIKHPLPNVC